MEMVLAEAKPNADKEEKGGEGLRIVRTNALGSGGRMELQTYTSGIWVRGHVLGI